MLNKLLDRVLLNKVTSCDLAVVLLSLACLVSAADSTLRALTNDVTLHHHNHNNRLLVNKKANSIPASSSSKTLPPFGPDILKGYQSCDEFKADLVKVLTLSGEKYIQDQKSISSCYYNDTITYYNTSIAVPYSQGTRRTQKRESSFGTNNQVSNVQEKELIQSDGKYIYAASGDRIIVSDLNGKVVVNVTIPSPSLTGVNDTSYSVLDSIFINNNVLSAFASLNVCDVDYNCNSTYSAFYFNFNQKTKTMTVVKQYDISSLFNSVDARQIGDYTYLLASAYFGDPSWSLYRCNEDFKDLSADEYEVAALAYLYNNVIRYANEIAVKLSKEGASSTCSNIIKMFNETIQQYDASFQMTKVFSIGLSSTSKKAFFFPFTSSSSHFSKNSILVSTQGNSGDSFLIKFSIRDLVITPVSVGTLDGSILLQYSIDLYNGYYRIASSSSTTMKGQVTVLKEQNSQLNVVGRMTVGAGTVQSVRFYNEKGFLVTTEWSGVYYNDSSTTMTLLNLTSPTNPSIAATELLNSPLYNMHPIGDGNYIISIDNAVSKGDASGITVYLFQATNGSLKLVGKPSEVIVTEQVNGYLPWAYSDAMWDFHAFRYLPQSHKLIIPVSVFDYSYYNHTDVNGDGNFQGFFVYDVDLAKGVKFLGNVTHDFTRYCYSYPSRSMVFNGDLITFMGNIIKRTSSVTTLSNLKWELENYCGFS